ncbi:MAG: PilN domain-containing protein, partial [Balneolaceae bacterium]
NNIRWTVTLDAFNAAVEETGGMWINSFRQNEDVIMLDGYSLTRNSIPELASKFPEVTLLSVRLEEIREREIYYFNMMLRDVVEDTSRFTPENSREIQQLLNP